MAVVSEFTSEFDNATNNLQLTTANSIWSDFFGTAWSAGPLMPKFDTAVKQSGLSSMKVDTQTSGTQGSLFLSAAFTGRGLLWSDFYIRVETAPTVNMAVVRWFAAASAIGDYRLIPATGSFQMQIRDGVNAMYSTPTLTINTWYRVAVLMNPLFQTGATPAGRGRAIVYAGANLDTMTATYDSGNLTMNSVLAACDNTKVGILGTFASSVSYHMDALITNDATQPAHAPGSPDIPALAENFENGIATNSILGTSFATSVTGGGVAVPAVYFADPYAGSLAARFNIAANSGSYRVQFSPETALWQKFRFKPVAAPAGGLAIIAFWSTIAGVLTKVMDLQLMADLTLRARDGTTNRTQSSASLVANAYAEIAVWVSPATNQMRYRLYTGAARGTTTATYDSGVMTMSTAGATDVSEMRFGVISADTVDFRFDRFAADRVSEPPAVAPPASTLAVTVNDPAGVEPYKDFVLTANPTGGVPPYTYGYTQQTGITTALTGTGATRTGTAPPLQAGATLTYLVTVTDAVSTTATDTATVTVLPQNLFSLEGGVWTPADLRTYDGTEWLTA